MEEIFIYIVMGVIYTIYSVVKNRGGDNSANNPPPPIVKKAKPRPEKTAQPQRQAQPRPVSQGKKQPQSIEEFLEGYLQEVEKGKTAPTKKKQATQHDSSAGAKKLEDKRRKQRAKDLRREKEARELKQQQTYQRKLEAERKRQAEIIAAKSKAKNSSLEVIDVDEYHEMKHNKMQEDYIKASEISSTGSKGLLEGFEFDVKDAVIYDVIFRRKYE